MAKVSQEDLDKMSFGRAFSTRRNELEGGGKTFTWRGNKYTTDLAEEAPARGSRSSTSRAPTESSRPQARRRSVDEVARSASAAIDRAEGKPATRPQQNPRRVPGPNEGTATSVSTPRVKAEPINREVRDAQDRAPVTPKINRQDVIPQIVQSFIDDARTPEQRSGAIRIAEEGAKRRVPGRAIIEAIRNFLSGEGPTDPSVILREGRNPRPTTAAPRRNPGSAGRAAGMARGGMVKKGNTDRRGKGMFYDSKSPRGYK